MKKVVKILSLLLIVCFAISIFSGCGELTGAKKLEKLAKADYYGRLLGRYEEKFKTCCTNEDLDDLFSNITEEDIKIVKKGYGRNGSVVNSVGSGYKSEELKIVEEKIKDIEETFENNKLTYVIKKIVKDGSKKCFYDVKYYRSETFVNTEMIIDNYIKEESVENSYVEINGIKYKQSYRYKGKARIKITGTREAYYKLHIYSMDGVGVSGTGYISLEDYTVTEISQVLSQAVRKSDFEILNEIPKIKAESETFEVWEEMYEQVEVLSLIK